MSKVLALYHIVFATRGRCRALHDVNRLDLHKVIASLTVETGSRMMCINSVTDHVHMLVDLSPKISLSDFMATIKAKSSAWLRRDERTTMFDGWCTGYYAVTVSPGRVKNTIQYIEGQTEHHRIAFFESEIKTMCQHLGLTYHDDDLR